MVVDGVLITGSGGEWLRQNAHVPILTGTAEREWSRKKRRFFFSQIWRTILGDFSFIYFCLWKYFSRILRVLSLREHQSAGG